MGLAAYGGLLGGIGAGGTVYAGFTTNQVSFAGGKISGRQALADRISVFNKRFADLMPRSIRKAKSGRRVYRALKQGRRMTLYHTTAPERADSISQHGLRAGKGGRFNEGSGRIYLGTPSVVNIHASASDPLYQVRVRRGFLTRDAEHHGSFIVKGKHVPRRLLRRVPNSTLSRVVVPFAIGAGITGAAAGAVGGYYSSVALEKGIDNLDKYVKRTIKPFKDKYFPVKRVKDNAARQKR